MKKGIVLMAALLSALAFSACGQQTASQSVKAETETAATEEKKESKEITVSEEAESEKADTKKDEAGGEEKAEKKGDAQGKALRQEGLYDHDRYRGRQELRAQLR